MIDPNILIDEEKILYNRAIELKDNWKTKDKVGFTPFLNLREQQIVIAGIGNDQGVFFGGYSEAERKMFGMFTLNLHIEFPIKAIELTTGDNTKLNHRWVLGSLIGIGVSRDVIGDIIPDDGSCVLLCSEKIEPFLLENFNKVGSYVVKVKTFNLENIILKQEFVRITGTISALRLDNLVALICKLSRGKATDILKNGRVQKNYKTEQRPATNFTIDDIITVQGFGKFIIKEVGGLTRKNRLPIVCCKYL